MLRITSKSPTMENSKSASSSTVAENALGRLNADGLCPKCRDFDIQEYITHKVEREESGFLAYESHFLEFTLNCRLCEFLLPESLTHVFNNDPRRGGLQSYGLFKGIYEEFSLMYEMNPTVAYFQKRPPDYSRPQLYFDAFDWLKQNISECDSSMAKGSLAVKDQHARCHQRTVANPHRIRFIDCKKRSVVHAAPDCQYLALSYVWGEYAQSSDIESAAATIKDAMTVTLKLGFQFLWVDQFCIDQTDPQDIHTQIHQMNRIYSNAVATLIDTAGNDPTLGLAGISRPRESFPVHGEITIKGLDLVRSLTGYDDWRVVNQSTWNSRGWTFQEALFSHRRIYFTENEVLYDCVSSFSRESWPQQLIRRNGEPNPCPKSWHNDINCYELVKKYASRNLSRKNDILRAFAGTLSALKDSPHSLLNFWGQPVRQQQPMSIRHDISCSLDFSFLNNSVKRREGFPSWSWAGWETGDIVILIPKELNLGWNPKLLPSTKVSLILRSHLVLRFIRVSVSRAWNLSLQMENLFQKPISSRK
jgi:hypothetical protein